MRYKVARMMFLSYGLVDIIGTLLLCLPIASNNSTNFMQAWFTATSALSVTGLTVVDTNVHWTLFGHIIILCLMQIGGLGLMVLTTVLWSFFGFKIHLGHRALLMQDRNYFSFSGALKTVKIAIILSFAIEFIGAVFIFLFLGDFRLNLLGENIFKAIFHGVSAFTGAGFDLTGQSFEMYYNNIGFNLVVVTLITLGSLGYLVLQELFLWRGKKRLSLHTKLVLVTTFSITVVGTIIFFALEFNHSLANLSLIDKGISSLFQAVTRTAGFNTIAVASWTEASLLIMILMMFIGASPGSVGGGLKTTTFAIILLTISSVLRGQKNVIAFEREISFECVHKSFLIAVIMLILVTLGSFILMITDGLSFLSSLFEVVSAMSSVGLSVGVARELSSFGQALLIVLMFVGRIGIFSLLVSLIGAKSNELRYMKEEVLIG